MNRKEDKTGIILIGGLIVILSVLANLVPYYVIKSAGMSLIGIILDNITLYYIICAAFLLPIGNILSSVIGNKVTGFLTFALSSFVYALHGEYTNLMVSLGAVIICALIYDNRKIKKSVSVLISSALITLDVVCVGYLKELLNFGKYDLFLVLISVFAFAVAVFALGFLIERIPLFKKFDSEIQNLDRNYRVHSINRKLMIIINIICVVLIITFSVIFTIMLIEKEKEKRTSEESGWEVMLTNVLEDDSYIYNERDFEKIAAESEVLRDAFDLGVISTPAYVVITTNLDDTFYQQVYVVTPEENDYDYVYAVSWVGESVLDENTASEMYFLPSDGLSKIAVMEQSRQKEIILNIISQILSSAMLLMVLMNILVQSYIRKNIVHPINRMTSEAVEFAFPDHNKAAEESGSSGLAKERFEVRSGDEIESLNKALHKTMDDVDAYITDVHKKNKELSDMQHNIIVTMADIIESRDNNTGGHIKRTALYVGIIAQKLVSEGAFPEELTEQYIQDMIVAAPLHDMGKIHVPDQILNKNGRLTDEEFGIMKTHAAVGKNLLDNASESLGNFRYLVVAKQMAESHHEWWNGNGYPNKISGEDIPLCARIMAVADVFDALVSKRCYKEPMDLDVAFGIIEKETGTHFDPVIGKAFLDSRPEVEETLEELTK